ncbi:MAG: hypothetical protein V1909_05380, partial [Candidatus Micrarchaeota archaeon]
AFQKAGEHLLSKNFARDLMKRSPQMKSLVLGFPITGSIIGCKGLGKVGPQLEIEVNGRKIILDGIPEKRVIGGIEIDPRAYDKHVLTFSIEPIVLIPTPSASNPKSWELKVLYEVKFEDGHNRTVITPLSSDHISIQFLTGADSDPKVKPFTGFIVLTENVFDNRVAGYSYKPSKAGLLTLQKEAA